MYHTEDAGGSGAARKFDAKAHRAWLRETWGDRLFSAAEVDKMRAFETGEP